MLLIQLVSCKTEKNPSVLFPAPVNNSMEIKYSELHFDSIVLNDEGVEASLTGFSGINHDGDYYFIDSRFCWYYVFDLNGNFKKRYLGYGQGPKEIPTGEIFLCSILNDTSLYLCGASFDNHIYDKDFNKKKMFFVKRTNDFLKDVSTDWQIYSPLLGNIVCRSYANDKVYMNIFTEWPDFNYITTTDEYLAKSKHILELNLVTEQMSTLYATGYPPVYYSNTQDYACLSYIVNFDIDKNGNFYVSYAADPLIYKYDNSFTPLYSFGHEGKNMSFKLKKVSNVTEISLYFRDEKINSAYYDWVEYIDETGLLFRSYKKGSRESTDGLQIYSDTKLIADVSVPKGLKVAGYVAPYYYSEAIVDEEKEILVVYRFKLD